MGYETNGYFSDDAEQWRMRNQAQNKALINLAERLNRHCHAVANELEINSANGQRVICSALFVRSLEFFQAALLLIERGMSSSIRASCQQSANC